MFEDSSDQTLSSTTAVGSMVQNSVISVSIAEKVESFRKSLPAAFLDTKTIKMSRSTDGTFTAPFITTFFVEVAGKALNRLLSLNGESAKLLGATQYPGRGRAKPDFFCFVPEGPVLMCGEMKRRNFLMDGDDLVLRYIQGIQQQQKPCINLLDICINTKPNTAC